MATTTRQLQATWPSPSGSPNHFASRPSRRFIVIFLCGGGAARGDSVLNETSSSARSTTLRLSAMVDSVSGAVASRSASASVATRRGRP